MYDIFFPSTYPPNYEADSPRRKWWRDNTGAGHFLEFLDKTDVRYTIENENDAMEFWLIWW